MKINRSNIPEEVPFIKTMLPHHECQIISKSPKLIKFMQNAKLSHKLVMG